MKKIWKKRKNSEAVSPVIATILMVAITVVLAAVLYVMVMGFGTTGAQTPTGAFTGTPQSTAVAHQYKLTFGVISPNTNFVDCKLGIANGANAPEVATITAGPAVSYAAQTTVYTVTFVDLGNDGTISVGDSLTVNVLAAGTFTVTLIFVSTGGQICAQTWTAT